MFKCHCIAMKSWHKVYKNVYYQKLHTFVFRLRYITGFPSFEHVDRLQATPSYLQSDTAKGHAGGPSPAMRQPLQCIGAPRDTHTLYIF